MMHTVPYSRMCLNLGISGESRKRHALAPDPCLVVAISGDQLCTELANLALDQAPLLRQLQLRPVRQGLFGCLVQAGPEAVSAYLSVYLSACLTN